MIHELKVAAPWFEPLMRRDKRFEVRYNDRNYAVGDELHLREWVQGVGYTGRAVHRTVNYILNDYHDGLREGYVVLGLES